MSGWGFHNPVRVHFGDGARAQLVPGIAAQRVLVVTTARGRRQMEADAPLADALARAAVVTWVDNVTPNPGLQETQTVIDGLAGQAFDLVVAFGGGSAMDAAKALAAALAPAAGSRDLAALIADPGRHMASVCLPIITLATTSGTGAEVTPFATIWDHARKKKLSLASPRLFPQIAIVDPQLTHGLPRDPTYSTGLDALNQAFESVWNRNRSPVSLAFAAKAIRAAMTALPRLAQDLSDAGARADMAEASLLAGMAISQTRTAICHSMSYPLTAHFDLAHGWACAATMGAVAHMAFEADPELFEALAPAAGQSSAAALLDNLDVLLDDLGVRQAVSRVIAAPEQAMALIPEMATPGRSDNFILDASPTRLSEIIARSLAA